MVHGDVKEVGLRHSDEGIIFLDLACISLKDLMSLSGDGLLPFACVMPGPTPKDQGRVHMQSDL